MSRDELTGMAELDDLSRELEAAGRRAERALQRDPAREQEIVGRLRAQLLGEAAEPADAEDDQVLIPLRPIVRTRLPGIRFSRSLVAGLAACLAVASLAVAAPLWLPRPVPAPTIQATPSPSATATLETHVPVVEVMPSPSATQRLPNTATPGPIDSTSPSAGPTPTPTGQPTSRPSTPPPTLRPASTPTPTATPVAVDMGPLTVTANPNGTYTLSWNAYTGSLAISSYALCYTTNENVVFGYVEHFGGVISVAKTATSWTGTFPWAATLRLKVEALYTPPSGAVQKAGETQVSILPYTGATPTPTTTPTPTPAPTATPVVNLGDFVTAQDNHDGTFTFSWNAYTGPLSVAYIISGTTTASGSFGYFEDTHLWSDSNPSDLTWTGPIASGSWRIKVEAISTSTGTMIKAAETNIYFLTIP
jgi:hypothetical protein